MSANGIITIVQILVVVAIRIVRRYSTKEANGFMRTSIGHELVGPKLLF